MSTDAPESQAWRDVPAPRADAVRIERINDVFAGGSELDELLADALLDPLLS
jgi:hypothetical protein